DSPAEKSERTGMRTTLLPPLKMQVGFAAMWPEITAAPLSAQVWMGFQVILSPAGMTIRMPVACQIAPLPTVELSVSVMGFIATGALPALKLWLAEEENVAGGRAIRILPSSSWVSWK